MLPVPGFDFGNSPREFTREAVEGKTILLSTTNGTAGARRGRRARVTSSSRRTSTSPRSLAFLRTAARGEASTSRSSARGASATSRSRTRRAPGASSRAIARGCPTWRSNDAAQACALLDRRSAATTSRSCSPRAAHGRALAAAGFAADLALCAAIDAFPVVPVTWTGRLRARTRLGAIAMAVRALPEAPPSGRGDSPPPVPTAPPHRTAPTRRPASAS